MIAGGAHKKQFQERLKRVKAGGANTTRQMYAGTAEPPRKRKRYETRVTQDMITDRPRYAALIPVYLIVGVLIGVGAVVLARYIRFRLGFGDLTGSNADLLMATDMVLAVTFAIVLRMIFRFKSKVHGAAKLIGIVATMLLMQNAVHALPGLFERAFSVGWVRQVMATTKADTILIAGRSFDYSLQELPIARAPNRRR